MRLGVNVWTRLGVPRLGVNVAELTSQRKPWVILNDARNRFESALGLDCAELMHFLSHHLSSDDQNVTVGLAHVSGNVYLGPALEDVKLSGEEVLLANLFSHGEIGLDAMASVTPPTSFPLLQSLSTYHRLRYLDAAGKPPATTPPKEAEEMEWAEVLKPVPQRLFKIYPLLREMRGEASSATWKGTCLQHSNFIHHDIVGESLEEYQTSAARIASKRAYSSATTAGGCALLTHEGLLISGSEISADRPSESGSISRISPLQCALVSLGANGLCPTTVLSMAYLGEVWPEDEMLKEEVIPQASMRRVDPE